MLTSSRASLDSERQRVLATLPRGALSTGTRRTSYSRIGLVEQHETPQYTTNSWRSTTLTPEAKFCIFAALPRSQSAPMDTTPAAIVRGDKLCDVRPV